MGAENWKYTCPGRSSTDTCLNRHSGIPGIRDGPARCSYQLTTPSGRCSADRAGANSLTTEWGACWRGSSAKAQLLAAYDELEAYLHPPPPVGLTDTCLKVDLLQALAALKGLVGIPSTRGCCCRAPRCRRRWPWVGPHWPVGSSATAEDDAWIANFVQGRPPISNRFWVSRRPIWSACAKICRASRGGQTPPPRPPPGHHGPGRRPGCFRRRPGGAGCIWRGW